MSIRDELKRLKKEEARLAIKKREITAKIKIAREKSASLVAIVKNSGYNTPRDLIKALQEISSAGVRRKVRRKVRKRKAKAPAKAPAKTRKRTARSVKRRKRTKITAALRDAIRKEVKGGTSKNKVAKSRGISYAVVTKAVTGAYSKIK